MSDFTFQNLDELEPLAERVLPKTVSYWSMASTILPETSPARLMPSCCGNIMFFGRLPFSRPQFDRTPGLLGLPQANTAALMQVFGYYASGSETEATLRDNRAVFSRYRLMPRMMVDVSNLDTTCTLLGTRHCTCRTCLPFPSARPPETSADLFSLRLSKAA